MILGLGRRLGLGTILGLGRRLGLGAILGLGRRLGLGAILGLGRRLGLGVILGLGRRLGLGTILGLGRRLGLGTILGTILGLILWCVSYHCYLNKCCRVTGTYSVTSQVPRMWLSLSLNLALIAVTAASIMLGYMEEGRDKLMSIHPQCASE